jgi:hypothetical protein
MFLEVQHRASPAGVNEKVFALFADEKDPLRQAETHSASGAAANLKKEKRFSIRRVSDSSGVKQILGEWGNWLSNGGPFSFASLDCSSFAFLCRYSSRA